MTASILMLAWESVPTTQQQGSTECAQGQPLARCCFCYFNPRALYSQHAEAVARLPRASGGSGVEATRPRRALAGALPPQHSWQAPGMLGRGLYPHSVHGGTFRDKKLSLCVKDFYLRSWRQTCPLVGGGSEVTGLVKT